MQRKPRNDWLLNWPIRKGAFNFWVNLPLFDPTAGGDVLRRLKRDAHVNIALGFLLPFVIPAVMELASEMIDPLSLANAQTMIWTMSAWAFLPASLIMRGVALGRIAGLIEEKMKTGGEDGTCEPNGSAEEFPGQEVGHQGGERGEEDHGRLGCAIIGGSEDLHPRRSDNGGHGRR